MDLPRGSISAFNLRLEIMCQSSCSDIALKLLEVYRNCWASAGSQFSEKCPDKVKVHWLDWLQPPRPSLTATAK